MSAIKLPCPGNRREEGTAIAKGWGINEEMAETQARLNADAKARSQWAIAGSKYICEAGCGLRITPVPAGLPGLTQPTKKRFKIFLFFLLPIFFFRYYEAEASMDWVLDISCIPVR